MELETISIGEDATLANTICACGNQYSNVMEIERLEAEIRSLRSVSETVLEQPGTALHALEYWNRVAKIVAGERARAGFALACAIWQEPLSRHYTAIVSEIQPSFDRVTFLLFRQILDLHKNNFLPTGLNARLIEKIRDTCALSDDAGSEARATERSHLQEFVELVSTGKVKLRGETLGLGAARMVTFDSEYDRRKEAFVGLRTWFLDHRDQLADIFDRLVRTRNQIAASQGLDTYISYGYMARGRVHYGPELAETFRKNIHTYVTPLLSRHHSSMAAEFGTSTLLPWDSEFYPSFPVARGTVPITTQLDPAEAVFDAISVTLGDHFRRMRSDGLIDLEARDDKRLGLFCTDFPDQRRAALFLNSAGDPDDLSHLFHEAGHAFQALESHQIPELLLQSPSTDIAEIPSTAMEYFSLAHLDLFFSPDDASRFRKYRFFKALNVLCYAAVVDEFEHWVYSTPSASPDQRDRIWGEIWDRYFPNVDFRSCPELKIARWYAQGHIFQLPFYFLDYAVAEIVALQLADLYESNRGQALSAYLQICRAGGTVNAFSILRQTGLGSPFDPDVIRGSVEFISKQLAV